MRLIDADALRRVIDGLFTNPVYQTMYKEDVIRAVLDAPTVAMGTDHITIKWTPDLDKLARDVAYRGLNEFSYMGKSLREWAEFILEQKVRTAWVSVKDRLPEAGNGNHSLVNKFLVYKSNGIMEVAYFTSEGKRTHWGKGRCLITHWMPLPEPPKEPMTDKPFTED